MSIKLPSILIEIDESEDMETGLEAVRRLLPRHEVKDHWIPNLKFEDATKSKVKCQSCQN
jgi:hypothetical protein